MYGRRIFLFSDWDLYWYIDLLEIITNYIIIILFNLKKKYLQIEDTTKRIKEVGFVHLACFLELPRC